MAVACWFCSVFFKHCSFYTVPPSPRGPLPTHGKSSFQPPHLQHDLHSCRQYRRYIVKPKHRPRSLLRSVRPLCGDGRSGVSVVPPEQRYDFAAGIPRSECYFCPRFAGGWFLASGRAHAKPHPGWQHSRVRWRAGCRAAHR